jgi:group I intron endonuclease
MKIGIIYCITNVINSNQYIGQTRNELNRRWKEHLTEASKYNQRPLYRAINKYGQSNFKIKILEECPVEKLNEREVYWIEKLNTFNEGYNATTGGNYFEHNQETKNKISSSMIDIERSDEWISNVSKALQNKIKKGELWGCLTGKHHNNEKLKRSVKAINLETGEEFIFNSITEGSKILTGSQLNTGNISRAIKEKFNAYGYKWEKIDNTPHKKSIIGIDKKTRTKIVRYESMRAAAIDLTGDGRKSGGGLRKSILNPGKNSWMGHYWFEEGDIEIIEKFLNCKL